MSRSRGGKRNRTSAAPPERGGGRLARWLHVLDPRRLDGRRLAPRAAAAIASGILLGLSYAPFGLSGLAWFALVPVLVACRFCTPREGAAMGFLAGLVAWTISLYWFAGMVQSQEAFPLFVFGAQLCLAGWCALFFVPLAGFSSLWLRRHGARGKAANLGWIALGACLWTGCEWLRSVLFTGFPYNPLAVTQVSNLLVIQVADLGGMWAVSLLVIAFNLGLAATGLRYHERTDRRLSWHPEVALPLLGVAAAFAYGAVRVRSVQAAPAVPLTVTCIQPNVSQYAKWDLAFAEQNVEDLWILTTNAAASTAPDLLIWPETCLPDHWRLYRTLINGLLDETETPILAGALHYEMDGAGMPVDNLFQNGSFLFTPEDRRFLAPNGPAPPVYNKRHLVMFGEYVPLSGMFPVLKRMTPIQFTCVPGESNAVFRTLGGQVALAPLICIEDILPYMSRRVVRDGARMLVNQTNDGWFDPYAGSEQHMVNAIFRCIEHRVPMVRCTNSGVTCCIRSTGVVHARLDRLEQGILHAEIRVPPAGHPPTVYGRVGDWPAVILLLVGCSGFVAVRKKPAGAASKQA